MTLLIYLFPQNWTLSCLMDKILVYSRSDGDKNILHYIQRPKNLDQERVLWKFIPERSFIIWRPIWTRSYRAGFTRSRKISTRTRHGLDSRVLSTREFDSRVLSIRESCRFASLSQPASHSKLASWKEKFFQHVQFMDHSSKSGYQKQVATTI